MNRSAIALLALLTACRGGARESHAAGKEPQAETAATTADTQSGTPESAFHFEKASDPMNDEDRSFVFSMASGETVNSFREAAVVWRCHGRDMEFVISAADFLTTSEPVSVQWRFDDRPAEGPTRWPVSTDGTAVFASDSLRIALTDEAMKATRLRVRLADYQGTHHDYDFSLTGLASALQQLNCTFDPARARIAAADQARAQAAAAAKRRADSARVAQRRAADSTRVAQAKAAAFAKVWPWVANPEARSYMPTNNDCWREWVDSATAQFFKTEQEAKAKGYMKSQLCPGGGSPTDHGLGISPGRPGKRRGTNG